MAVSEYDIILTEYFSKEKSTKKRFYIIDKETLNNIRKLIY